MEDFIPRHFLLGDISKKERKPIAIRVRMHLKPSFKRLYKPFELHGLLCAKRGLVVSSKYGVY
jgi:hypothetical protein